MVEDDKRRSPFEPMKYLSDLDFSEFLKEFEEQQTPHGKNMDELVRQSSEIGKDVGEVIEENVENYKGLMDEWKDFTDISEDLVKPNLDEEAYKEFQEYNREVNDKLKDLVSTSLEDAEELYSAWTDLSESIFQGIKAGTGPDPDEVIGSTAEFQKTTIEIARRNVEERNGSLKEVRETLEEITQKTTERMKEGTEERSDRFEGFMKAWQNSLKKMEENVTETLEENQENYRSAFDFYFDQRALFPFFSWSSQSPRDEYDEELRDLEERIEDLEEKIKR